MIELSPSPNNSNNNTTTETMSNGDSSSSVDPLASTTTTNATTAAHHNNHSNHTPNSHKSSAWAAEGVRRIRTIRILQNMRTLTMLSALGGFLFGYDTGVVSGALLQLQHTFDLSKIQQEVVVSITVLSAFGASVTGGRLLHQYGRQPCIRAAASIFTLGSLVLGTSWSYPSLVLGRFIVGLGIGVASLATPLYIAEMAVPEWRGRLVTVNALLVTVGQFVAGIVDGVCAKTMPETGWRWMLGLAAIPSIIMLWGFARLPESPRWLCMVGRDAEARQVLQNYRASDEEVEQELQDILQSLQDPAAAVTEIMPPPSSSTTGADADETEEDALYGATHSLPPPPASHTAQSSSSSSASTPDAIRAMLADVPTRRALTLGCGLMLVQQCCGINTVMYYAASIYTMLEFSETTSVWLSAFTALAQVVGIAISIVLVDRWGRRTLVLWSLAGVGVALVGLGGSFYLARIASTPVKAFGHCAAQANVHVWDGVTRYCMDCLAIPGCGVCGHHCVPAATDNSHPADVDLCLTGDHTSSMDEMEWTTDHCHNAYGWLSVLFMVLYLLAFGIGMGGLPWTINSEIYPLQHRSLAMSCSTATNWIGNLLVAATFLSLAQPQALTTYGAFWLYASVAGVGWIWLYTSLPETKGLSLEEIERLFQRGSDGYDQIGLDDDDDEDDDDDSSLDSEESEGADGAEMAVGTDETTNGTSSAEDVP